MEMVIIGTLMVMLGKSDGVVIPLYHNDRKENGGGDGLQIVMVVGWVIVVLMVREGWWWWRLSDGDGVDGGNHVLEGDGKGDSC